MKARSWTIVSFVVGGVLMAFVAALFAVALLPDRMVGKNPAEVRDELQAQEAREAAVQDAESNARVLRIVGPALFLAVGLALGGPLISLFFERQLREGR